MLYGPVRIAFPVVGKPDPAVRASVVLSLGKGHTLRKTSRVVRQQWVIVAAIRQSRNALDALHVRFDLRDCRRLQHPEKAAHARFLSAVTMAISKSGTSTLIPPTSR